MVALGDPGRARERTLESGAASASFNAWKTGRGAGDADALAVRDWIAAVLRQTLEDWQGRSTPLALVNYYGLRECAGGPRARNARSRSWRQLRPPCPPSRPPPRSFPPLPQGTARAR